MFIPKIRTKPTATQKMVFGHDVKLDEFGHPIEQGLGSPGNMTVQHVLALIDREGDSEEHQAMLAAAIERARENPAPAPGDSLPEPNAEYDPANPPKIVIKTSFPPL
jgi:hypothetical protein